MTTKHELTAHLQSRISTLRESIKEWGDRDELIENAASGGNHDDTFSMGENLGYLDGQLYALRTVLEMLELDLFDNGSQVI